MSHKNQAALGSPQQMVAQAGNNAPAPPPEEMPAAAGGDASQKSEADDDAFGPMTNPFADVRDDAPIPHE